MIKRWKRAKSPTEKDVRYGFFNDDLPEGESVASVVAAVVEGDMVVADYGHVGNRVHVVLDGGTVTSLVRFTVTTDQGNTIIREAVQPIAA